ncbi:unnamed protein product [Chrysoparadoxa australica]
MEERSNRLRESKNGGSMTPQVLGDLRHFESLGRLEILEQAQVVTTMWEESAQGLASGEGGSRQGSWSVTFDSGDMRTVDVIWCATGTTTDFRTEPLFADLQKYRGANGEGVQVVGGLPVVTEELRVHDELNVFLTGNYAALRVGPGALNLMGGRAAAARIAPALGIGLRDTKAVQFACQKQTARVGTKQRKMRH